MMPQGLQGRKINKRTQGVIGDGESIATLPTSKRNGELSA